MISILESWCKMGLVAAKPVFRVSKTSLLSCRDKLENSLRASLDMILYIKRKIKALTSLRWSVPLLFATTKDRFSHWRPKWSSGTIICNRYKVHINIMHNLQCSLWLYSGMGEDICFCLEHFEIIWQNWSPKYLNSI